MNDHRRPGKRLENFDLAALNALGNLHFAFAREQRNRTHFPQVHPHRIVGFIEGTGGKIKLNILARFIRFEVVGLIEGDAVGSFGAGGIENFNALAVEHGKQVAEVFRGVHVGGKEVVDLFV